jgi:hypothetical protein
MVWAPASCKGRHIGVRIYESPHAGRLLGWVSVRVGGKRGLGHVAFSKFNVTPAAAAGELGR